MGFLHHQIRARATLRPRMDVMAGSGHAGMAERGLYEVDGGAAVERMTGMAAPEYENVTTLKGLLQKRLVCRVSS
jgi:hypothetical protein